MVALKLLEEFKCLRRNIRFWLFKHKDTRIVTYFRFIKFSEFIVKELALATQLNKREDQIDLVKAIEFLQSNGTLKLHEFKWMDKQRSIRNGFIHDLGINYTTREMKSDMSKSLHILNVILSRVNSD